MVSKFINNYDEKTPGQSATRVNHKIDWERDDIEVGVVSCLKDGHEDSRKPRSR